MRVLSEGNKTLKRSDFEAGVFKVPLLLAMKVLGFCPAWVVTDTKLVSEDLRVAK
jgi:hypothetical protein